VRHALADEQAFYEWVRSASPDTTTPVPPDTPAPMSPDTPAPVDLEAGWTLIEAFDWPVEPGFSGINTVGPISPDGAIPADRWPADGFYEAAAQRSADDLTMLRLTLRRWVACGDVVDSPCPPDDPITEEDRRITPDPASEIERTVPIDSVRIVLVPIYGSEPGVVKAIEGDPGAFATLLTHGIDPAYREWIDEPFRDGASLESIQRDLLDRSQDPGFPFGTDYTEERDQADPVAYRGPFGVSLLADPTWTEAGPWPPGPDGLYGWQVLTLEVRDGQPILYILAGQIAS
jgi:hypothetical protein